VKLVRTAGVEPTTPAFGGLYSIQMSYVRTLTNNRSGGGFYTDWC
jgi:hypothetical protein